MPEGGEISPGPDLAQWQGRQRRGRWDIWLGGINNGARGERIKAGPTAPVPGAAPKPHGRVKFAVLLISFALTCHS